MKFTIGGKMLAAFGSILLLIALSYILTFNLLREYSNDIGNYRSIFEESQTAQELQLKTANIWQFITDASLTKNIESINIDARHEMEQASKLLEKLTYLHRNEPQTLEIITEITTDLSTMFSTGERMFRAYSTDRIRGDAVMTEYDAISAKTIDKITGIVKQTSSQSDQAVSEMAAMLKRGFLTLLLFGILILGVSVIVSILSTRSITQPVAKLRGLAENLADGDASLNIDIKSTDEIGDMARSFQKMIGYLQEASRNAEEIANNNLSLKISAKSKNDVLNKSFEKMVSNLREMAIRIGDASDQVASSSEELSKTAQSLSEGSQKQASSLEESSAAMEEMAASVAQVSEKAQNQASSVEEVTSSMEEMSASLKNVSELAGSVKTGAETSVSLSVEAEKTSSETMTAMKGIEESSNKIKNIIDVISDIADQTNLLALNASIEAARAGDAGRGFAVVAKEISKLADKSAEATKEIEDLINETGRTVDSGVEKVRSVDQSIKKIREAAQAAASFGGTMSQASEEQLAAVRQITEAIQNVNTMSQNIAAAAEEQASTSVETGKTIEGVSTITQQNAASAEEMASSTEELSSLAENMKKLVSQFKV
jgi:methyl-accepting chemotaxis protein